MANANKRYLVTYNDASISASDAQSRLQGFAADLTEGAPFMATAESLEDDNALHFENLEISSVSLEEGAAAELASLPEIRAVEEDVAMSILGFLDDDEEHKRAEVATLEQENLWNINMVDAPDAWTNGYTGVGVNLAIIDTGIATHPDLVISGGVSKVPGVTSYNDDHGHGTHCAGTAAGRNGLNNVYGVARNANLYAVKVMDSTGHGSSTNIIAGMSWCITNNMDVASMSLGGRSGPNNAYIQAVKSCQSNDVVVIIAAGNWYTTSFPWVCSPANSIITGDSDAIPVAIAAIDSNKNIAYFSSRGGQTTPWNQITVSAPGVSIYSTYLNDGYTTMSGTSMACPHVAGLAALCKQRYGVISAPLISAKISATCSALGTGPYPNEAYGYGLINCDKATD